MTAFRLPAHLRPFSLIVYVRSDDGVMLGAYAAVGGHGLRQSRLQEEGCAASHAQAVLSVLVRALRPVRQPLPGLCIYLPDRTVVAMLDGSMDPRSAAMDRLVVDARHMLTERAPGAVVGYGQFHNLVAGMLQPDDDIWV